MKSRPLTQSEINALRFDDGCTAKGTETKPQKRWRDPHSSLAVMTVSPRASLLSSARGGDDKAADVLANCIADDAYRHVWINKDRICIDKGRDFIKMLADIAVYRAVHNEQTPQRHCAAILGISKRAYVKAWEPRIFGQNGIYEQWCMRLVKELE